MNKCISEIDWHDIQAVKSIVLLHCYENVTVNVNKKSWTNEENLN